LPLSEWAQEVNTKNLFHVDEKDWIHPNLSEPEIQKAKKKLDKIYPKVISVLNLFNIETEGPLKIIFRSANTFPASAGIASSASSMASLTLALSFALAKDKDYIKNIFNENESLKCALAGISREASGSSCRSFLGPFVFWDEKGIFKFKSESIKKLPKFSDILILVSQDKKEVSSSTAHEKVKSSPFWHGRCDRATQRIHALEKALSAQDWKKCALITFNESLDMHNLFHTSKPSFSYYFPDTQKVIDWYKSILEKEDQPPLFTMDAGPNVHLLVPSQNKELWIQRLKNEFPRFNILSDEEGNGASILGFFENLEGRI